MKFFRTGSAIFFFTYSTMVIAAALPNSSNVLSKRDGYAASCTILSLDAPFLTAECTQISGDRVISDLNLNDCFGNDNGVLVIGGGTGDFASTCQDFKYDDFKITASCKDRSGNLRTSTFETDMYLSNHDGTISCDL